jgi:cell division protease FtsH
MDRLGSVRLSTVQRGLEVAHRWATWLHREGRLALRQWRRSRVAKRKTRSRQTYVLAGVLVLLVVAFVSSLAYLAPKPVGERLTIDQLTKLAQQHRILTATFRDEDAQIVGSFSCPAPVTSPTSKASTATSPAPFVSPSAVPPPCPTVSGGASPVSTPTFWVTYPKSDTATSLLMQLLTDAGSRVAVNAQTRKAEMHIVTTLVLPLVILANLFVLLFTANRGSTSGIGEVETFGSIGKGRFNRRRKTPVTFSQVAGADEAIEELKDVRDYLADPERYKLLGATPPRGVLLIGPPGCGKTLLAKAVAGEVGVPFFSVAGAEFVESLVGVGAARVRDLFRRVRAVAPAVVFIDELDAAGRKRASGGGAGGNEEREQTLNQILVEMDGFDIGAGIVVMGATNRPDILDPALLRPGRFDRHVTVERPDVGGRAKILELHARGKPLAPDVDFVAIARRTPGFSGADLANVVNESALLAIRQGKSEIELEDVEEGVQRALTGAIRRTRTLSVEERKRIAYHEGGHVIVAAASGRFADVSRVSILARGRNLGNATFAGDEDVSVFTRTHLRQRLAIHLAGVAAEELIFGEPSTGAEQDLEAATNLARDIVARYGMSDKLGKARLLAPDADEFLDAEVPLGAVSGLTHQEVDAEIRASLAEAQRQATQILLTHQSTLDALATRLEEVETLEGEDLEELLAAVQPEMELFGSVVARSRNGHRPGAVLVASKES